MRAGYAQVSIMPQRAMPLCGFAARCNAPFESVDDPIYARALALFPHDVAVVILAYDLVGLGRTTTIRIEQELQKLDESVQYILCATHTHSAPAAIQLRGCGDMQDDYQDFLIEKSVEAADLAIKNTRPAIMRWATRELPGQSYNRRRILEDGRISMASEPGGKIVSEGPILSRMVLIRFDDKEGQGIGGIVSWPCHAATVCSLNLSADFPGEFCRRLFHQHHLPFMFLQGAGANINPFFEKMTREEMLRNVDNIIGALGEVSWSEQESSPAISYARQSIDLQYDRQFSADELRQMSTGMSSIAETGNGPEEMMTILGDILNVKPGTRPQKTMAMHIAGIIRDWSAELIPLIESGNIGNCTLETHVLNLGKLVFCFIAAEPFVETALKLQEAYPDRVVTVVGYMAPLVGYLPTDQALDEGGYESDYAYRFYNHPGPFKKGSEKKVVETLRSMIFGAQGD